MKTNITEMAFILDRSGSMSGLETDTVGGYNSMLAKQKELDLAAAVTTVLFDDRYELLHDRADIKAVSPITEKEYYVRGSTALLDAIGRTIVKIERSQEHIAKEYKADNVVVVIITDGMENSSIEYTSREIKSIIKAKEEREGWEFIFLGANIDAIATARDLGVREERAANYHADKRGIGINFNAISSAVQNIRTFSFLPDDWKEEIDADYSDRNFEE